MVKQSELLTEGGDASCRQELTIHTDVSAPATGSPVSTFQPEGAGIESLEEGVYRKVPAFRYHSLPETAVSRGDLLMLDPPAKYRYFKDHPEEKTASDFMDFGTAFHSLIMEPDMFRTRHVLSKFPDFRTKEARAWRDEQLANGVTILSAEDMNQLDIMEQSMREHPMFSSVFRRADAAYEVSVLANHPSTGILRRARFDAAPPGSALHDIKSISAENGGSPEGAGKAIAKMGYGFQAAHYLSCWNAVSDRKKTHFVCWFVESEPPYLCAAYTVPPELIDYCKRILDARLYLLAECREKRTWPGYEAFPDKAPFPELPGWLQHQIDQ